MLGCSEGVGDEAAETKSSKSSSSAFCEGAFGAFGAVCTCLLGLGGVLFTLGLDLGARIDGFLACGFLVGRMAGVSIFLAAFVSGSSRFTWAGCMSLSNFLVSSASAALLLDCFSVLIWEA